MPCPYLYPPSQGAAESVRREQGEDNLLESIALALARHVPGDQISPLLDCCAALARSSTAFMRAWRFALCEQLVGV